MRTNDKHVLWSLVNWDELTNITNEEYHNEGSNVLADETKNENSVFVIVITNHNALLIANEHLEQAHVLSKDRKEGARLNPINYDVTVIVKSVLLLIILVIIVTLLCQV